MPTRRHDLKRSITRKAASHRAATHVEKLALIRRYEPIKDPTNERAISRRYNQLKHFPESLAHKTNKEQREILTKRGFFVTKKGVFVDAPRDSRRRKIKGARLRISKQGTVVWSVKQRRDYIVGLTKKERAAFAKDPEKIIAQKEQESRKQFPNIGKRKVRTRLQWGAYQATKDFDPRVFNVKYFAKFLPREKEHKMDKLTGIHFVVHVPRAKRKKHAKRKNRRS